MVNDKEFEFDSVEQGHCEFCDEFDFLYDRDGDLICPNCVREWEEDQEEEED